MLPSHIVLRIFTGKISLAFFPFKLCKMYTENGLQVSIMNLYLNSGHTCYCTKSSWLDVLLKEVKYVKF